MSADSDRPAAPDPATAGTREGPLGRRAFLRALRREALGSAVAVADTALTLQRDVIQAGAGIVSAALAGERAATAVRGGASSVFRSPYRIDGDSVVLLDQRVLPGIREIRAVSPDEVAEAIESGAVRGAPVVAHLAAYAVWLASRRDADRSAAGAAVVRLRRVVGDHAQAVDALDRMTSVLEVHGPGTASPLDVALRAQADAVALASSVAHARIGRHALSALPAPTAGPLRVLLGPEGGATAGGMVGITHAVLNAAALEGREVFVLVADTPDDPVAARVLAWELRLAGLAFRAAPLEDLERAANGDADEADAPLRAPHVVLVAAAEVFADGSVRGATGSAALARIARALSVPLVVCAPTTALVVADSFTPAAGADDHRDVPAHDVSLLVTEHGVLAPPFAPALAAMRAERRRGIG